MMMNVRTFFEKNWYYLAILLGFIVIGFLYFSPLLSGKTLPQMDDIHAKAMANELVKHKEATGEDAHWTNSMFGGMPAYQIKGGTSYSIFLYLNRFLRLGLPFSTVALIFLYMLGFFVLLKSLKADTLLSLAGSVAFAFASYNIVIIGAGHITKAYAIAFMAPALAGMILTYRGKFLAGTLLALLGIGLEISSNHPQIAYYLAITMFILFISELVLAAMHKTWAVFAKATAIIGIVGILGLLPNITTIWTTYEYGKESIRGGSDLVKKTENTGGLDKGYALAWSYGIGETATILIPDFMGGSSSKGFDEDSETYKVLTRKGNVDPRQAKQIASRVAYWGDMPFTEAPVYFGAVIIFFFVLGMFIVENRYRWWIFAATLLSIFLAWGRNWETFTNIFFYYVPMYNKFRTVSMALVIANVLMVLLAILAIKAVYDGKRNKDDLKRYAIISFAIVGGFSLIFALIPGVFFDFKSVNDPPNFPDWLMKAIYSDRESWLRLDAVRSLIFSVLSFGLAWLLIDDKVKKQAFGIILILLMFIDFWPIAKRYVNESQFVKATTAKAQFVQTDVDQFILKDTDPNYRVLNLTRNPWSDAYTSYYHKSIGGYHGAKLSRYQDLIDRQLSRNNANVINMLNTKYIITFDKKSGQPVANINFDALGHAWFVNEVEFVEDANAEMSALDTFNPEKKAIVDKRFKTQLEGLKEYEFFAKDTGKITLKEYRPDYLHYETDNKNDQLAVFSEVYYNRGWNAYIDGTKADYLRANYVLRALRIPEGKHKIEWRFEPQSLKTGNTLAMISSVIVGLLLVGLIFLLIRQELQSDVKGIKDI